MRKTTLPLRVMNKGIIGFTPKEGRMGLNDAQKMIDYMYDDTKYVLRVFDCMDNDTDLDQNRTKLKTEDSVYPFRP